jgi:hypothetical protein
MNISTLAFSLILFADKLLPDNPVTRALEESFAKALGHSDHEFRHRIVRNLHNDFKVMEARKGECMFITFGQGLILSPHSSSLSLANTPKASKTAGKCCFE